jgi:hypothetical protein
MLSGDLALKQASLRNGVSSDACVFEQDCLASVEVDAGLKPGVASASSNVNR